MHTHTHNSGRTDLPYCDEKEMMQSLSRMLDLNDDVVVFPGHMDTTTIGEEKLTNPFLRAIASSR
jgi:hydroxyacylglutathione hydrolase